MAGFFGDDTYVVDNFGDQVNDIVGQGRDTLFTYVTYVLSNGQEIETLTTVAHRDTTAIDLYGNDYDNHLIGNFGDNFLNGRGGADTMTGFFGNDTYVVDNAGDVIEEFGGGGTNDSVLSFVNFTLAGGIEVELLSAASHRDTGNLNLFGNEFGQTVHGNFGNNTINGGGGSDVLVGLSGFDTFVFSDTLGASNVDRIQDFDTAADTILLDNLVFTGLAEGGLNAAAFRTGTAAQDADDRIIYNPATGALLFDVDGNGAQAAVQFAILPVELSVSHADFFVI
jgi:Ca2+-binding RTX toxin-like protein